MERLRRPGRLFGWIEFVSRRVMDIMDGRRTVSYGLDSTGRLSSLSSAATTYAAAASVSNIAYTAHGALTSETLGNSLIHQISYNTRLQPSQIQLGTSGNPTSVLNLTYSYGSTDNNGNVKNQMNTIGTLAITNTYNYDSLNRISSAAETSTGGSGWTLYNSGGCLVRDPRRQ